MVIFMNNTDLTKGSITKLIFKLSIPMIIAQLINLLYNIVDRIYIGHYGTEEVSKLALSGLGACFPIIIIVSAFSALFGMGGAPLVGIALGQKDLKKAKQILNNSFILLTITSLVIIPILLIFKKPILLAFGANSENVSYAIDYLNIYILGTFFVMISLGLNQYITAQGKTLFAMLSIIIGAVSNIILDPIFIFGFDMGVKGAALATIISQAISAVFIMVILVSKISIIKLNPFKTKLSFSIIKSISLLGLSPFIMQSTEALIQICFNNQIKNYISDLPTETTYLAAMTTLITLMSLVNMPMQGLAQGTQPIISQNYGAGEIKRAKEASIKLIIFCFAFSFIFVLSILIFPRFYVGIFADTKEIVDTTAKLIPLFLIGMMFMGIQIGCQNSFLALGKSKISLILALLRKIILLIPLTLILPLFLQEKGIFIAETTADILAITITLLCYLFLFNKYLKEKENGKIKKTAQ